eukprot:1280042-Prymnesium_polylepis.1
MRNRDQPLRSTSRGGSRHLQRNSYTAQALFTASAARRRKFILRKFIDTTSTQVPHQDKFDKPARISWPAGEYTGVHHARVQCGPARAPTCPSYRSRDGMLKR